MEFENQTEPINEYIEDAAELPDEYESLLIQLERKGIPFIKNRNFNY